ncbi:MAG: AbrB/MazE/SpoVT family DNA-binding domain-containing protein [Planctomycetota bacterium]
MAHVRTSSKGAVVIPKAVREAAGLKPGQMVNVALEGKDMIVVRPLPEDPIEALYGILKGDGCGTVDDFIKERRREDRARARRL